MINIPFVKGHYDWNSQKNVLEFISDKEPGEVNEKKKRSRTGFQTQGLSIAQFIKESNTPNRARGVSAGGYQVAAGPGQTTSPRLSFFRQDHSVVTLQHVKSVAFDDMTREKFENKVAISQSFKILFDTEQFNNFLYTLLRYFAYFMEGIEQQKRPHKTRYLQPSKAEIRAMEETKKKMNIAKRHFGQAYCTLLLGIGMEDQHHMRCGKMRVSATRRDKRMYEDLYLFCTILVHIAFRRREFHRIQSEVGDMLRSSTYNPSQRKGRPTQSGVGHRPPKSYVKDLSKPIGERIDDLLAVQLPEVDKITPAAYRRQYGKRPAITKAIHQRSTALVSLLPLPEESANYLFKPTAAERKLARKYAGDASEDDPSLRFDMYGTQNVGIVGEPMEMFNPDNLAPKTIDNEDDTDSHVTEAPIVLGVGEMPSEDQDKIRTISRATTEASIAL